MQMVFYNAKNKAFILKIVIVGFMVLFCFIQRFRVGCGLVNKLEKKEKLKLALFSVVQNSIQQAKSSKY